MRAKWQAMREFRKILDDVDLVRELELITNRLSTQALRRGNVEAANRWNELGWALARLYTG